MDWISLVWHGAIYGFILFFVCYLGRFNSGLPRLNFQWILGLTGIYVAIDEIFELVSSGFLGNFHNLLNWHWQLMIMLSSCVSAAVVVVVAVALLWLSHKLRRRY